ncbi:chloride channel protein [Ferruginibacter sp.]
MAAMFAGASRAFLTSVVFALETTGQVNGLLPLLGACSVAYFVSFFFMKGSIMTEKIIRRGVKTPDAYEPDVLHGANVEELITAIPVGTTNLPYVYKTDDAGLAAEMLGKYNLDTLLVLDNKANMQPVGIITSTAILKYYSDQKLKDNSYASPKRTQKIMVHGRKLMKKMSKK